MISYESIKEKVSERKPQLVYAGCVLIAFLVGFGAGRANPQRYNDAQKYSNYSTSGTNTANAKEPASAANDTPKTSSKATTTREETSSATSTKQGSSSSTCTGIKGNISGKTKTYHVPGGSFYERTQEEQCFKTEEEAVAAGFTKAKR